MPLDFSLLGQGVQFGNVLQAYEHGKEQRKATDTKNALALYATDPEKGISAIRTIDPVLGMKLQDDFTARKTAAERKAVFQEADPVKRQAAAAATGDPDTIRAETDMRRAAMEMDEKQRAHAKELTDTAGGILVGMRMKMTPDERRAQWAKIPPEQKAILVGPDADTFDPTDANLDAKITQLQGFHGALEQANKDREFKSKDENLKADNERAAAQAAETARHNGAMEGAAFGNLAVSRARLSQEGANNKAVTQLSPEEIQASGLPKGTVAQRDGNGRISVISKPGDRITEGDRNTANYAYRMVGANDTMNSLASSGIVKPTAQVLVSENGGVARLVARNQKDAQFVQAANEWIMAKLRKESGAAIGAQELQNDLHTYFPEPGDSDAVVRQKAASRRRTMAGMLKQSAPAYEQSYGALPSQIQTRFGPDPKGKAAASSSRPALGQIFK